MSEQQGKSVIELPQSNYTRREDRELPAIQANPMAILAAAVQRGMDPATLKDLKELYEWSEKNEARKAFNRAFAAFKAEAVKIIKNRAVTAGPLQGKRYAELFSVVNSVTPALSAQGLSASWKITKDEREWIEVTCTITHELGHSESVSMGGPPDAGGAKNMIQARASTITYLERYTLKAICGVAEDGDDTDGRPPQALTGMPAQEFDEWVSKIKAATTKAAAKAKWTEGHKACIAYNDLDAAKRLKESLMKRAESLA